MGMPGGWELVLVLVVIVLFFGGKKIPELAKGIGRGIKDFKKAINEDDEKETKEIENRGGNQNKIQKSASSNSGNSREGEATKA
jgi:sec-independent protein translocase protein TatA